MSKHRAINQHLTASNFTIEVRLEELANVKTADMSLKLCYKYCGISAYTEPYERVLIIRPNKNHISI